MTKAPQTANRTQQKLLEAVGLQRAGRNAEAADLYRSILKRDPGQSDALNLLGASLIGLGRHDEALKPLMQLVKKRPDHAGGHFNLALAFSMLERLDEAIDHYRHAIRLKPGEIDARNNLGQALTEAGRLDEAVAELRATIALRPDFPIAHRNLGTALLLQGQLAEGFREYAWRWRTGETKPRTFRQPPWDGRAPTPGGLLVHAEQGLGDTLQFVRYFKSLTSVEGRKILICQPQLLRLLRHSMPDVEFIGPKDDLPEFQYHAALLDLPMLRGTDLASVPAPIPYLRAEPDLIEQWGAKLGTKPGMKIGICWQGNPKGNIDKGRSFPLAAFEPLAGIEGVRLVSLQKSDGLDQLASAPAGLRVETLGEGFDNGPDAFIDTAAVMMNLDLVITSDTSVAHLAGALGRPVWVALKYVPDWRWMLQGDDSPWYPGMRLFRQSTRNDWTGVFARMALELRERRAQPRNLVTNKESAP